MVHSSMKSVFPMCIPYVGKLENVYQVQQSFGIVTIAWIITTACVSAGLWYTYRKGKKEQRKTSLS